MLNPLSAFFTLQPAQKLNKKHLLCLKEAWNLFLYSNFWLYMIEKLLDYNHLYARNSLEVCLSKWVTCLLIWWHLLWHPTHNVPVCICMYMSLLEIFIQSFFVVRRRRLRVFFEFGCPRVRLVSSSLSARTRAKGGL